MSTDKTKPIDVLLPTEIIPKNEFDWKYYLDKNPDIKLIASDLNHSYQHWITFGSYENRWVRNLKSEKEFQVFLKSSFKLKFKNKCDTLVGGNIGHHVNDKQNGCSKINLSFKIAIMIHIFDVKLLCQFINYLNTLFEKYNYRNFDIYLNIVAEQNPHRGNLQDFVEQELKLLKETETSIRCHYGPNRGGDIGGLLILSKLVIDSSIDYKYAIFVHGKKNHRWRKDLCRCVFNVQFEQLNKFPDLGIIGCRQWIYTFDSNLDQREKGNYQYHLIELSRIYQIDRSTHHRWQFVAGTMFLANIEIIKYIVSHQIEHVYQLLNRVDSVDVNWLMLMISIGQDYKNCVNDYQYRLNYGKSLLSDYMIEHTFERFIGLVCQHLGLKIIGE